MKFSLCRFIGLSFLCSILMMIVLSLLFDQLGVWREVESIVANISMFTPAILFFIFRKKTILYNLFYKKQEQQIPTLKVEIQFTKGETEQSAEKQKAKLSYEDSKSPLYLIKYRDGEGYHSERIVKIINFKDDYYLNAYCYLRDDKRTFRLDRIGKEIVDFNTGEILSKLEWLEKFGVAFEVSDYA